MKKISLILPLFLLVGCGSSVSISNINPFKQPSINQQKMDAQNAWDELDGKVVTTPKANTTSTSKTNTSTNTHQAPNITNVVKSMLETADSIPDWFYAPPKSDKYFYGAGEGTSVEEAKNGALNFIAGEIQTAVSSTFTKNESFSNSNGNSTFYKNVSNQIRAKVKQINFTNIEIMKTLKVDNKIYILVRINKQKLFNSLKTQFETLDSQITSEVNTAKKYSLLDQLITYNKLTPKIADAMSQLNILNTLNPNFDIKPYVQKYNNYIAQKTELLHKITFSVSPNDLFTQKLIEVLNNQNYKISKHSDIKIKLQKQVRKSTTMGMAIVRVTVNIKVNAKGKTLKSTSIEVKGISNTHSQALAKAAIDFKQKLQKLGINKLLGFE